MAGESGRDERRKQRELEEGRKVRDVDASGGVSRVGRADAGGRCASRGSGAAAGKRAGRARATRAGRD